MSIILDGTNGIAAANVFGRNIIINGDGRINQRGYVSGTATTGANEYTLDRWRVVTSGQNLAFTGDDSGREMTAPAGGVEQVIEDKNIAGGTYVINWEGTATATVGGNAVTKGGTFTLTANTNTTLRMIDGTFKNVQIEQGSVATPFERRPFGTELQLCQRYFWLNGGVAAFNFVAAGFATSTTSCEVYVAFPVEMRAQPTADRSGLRIRGNNVSPAVTSIVSNFSSRLSADLNMGVASGLTAGLSVCLQINGSATDYLSFSAEL
jgi:hypothetical protein